MGNLDRMLQPHYGPRFYRVDGNDYFEHRIDSRNGVGPRVATRIDKENHAKLWAEYQAALTAEHNAGLVGNAPGLKKKGK